MPQLLPVDLDHRQVSADVFWPGILWKCVPVSDRRDTGRYGSDILISDVVLRSQRTVVVLL